TTEFSPIIRAIQAPNPDLVVICSYPNTSVGMVQTASELGLKPKMMGGGMVGIQYTAIKSKLKSKLNGIVNYEFWVPTPKLMAPAADFFKKYQAQAPSRGIDPLGYYLGGWVTLISRCCNKLSKPPRASTTTRSPTTCARMPSARS